MEDLYDGLGQLTNEYQERSGAVNTSTSLQVQHAWNLMGRQSCQLTGGSWRK